MRFVSVGRHTDLGVNSVNQKTLPSFLPSFLPSWFFEKDTCMNCHFVTFLYCFYMRSLGGNSGGKPGAFFGWLNRHPLHRFLRYLCSSQTGARRRDSECRPTIISFNCVHEFTRKFYSSGDNANLNQRPPFSFMHLELHSARVTLRSIPAPTGRAGKNQKAVP